MSQPTPRAAIGILMLETRFPRIPGDVGNPRTFDFPVLYEVVQGASPDRVVRQGAKGLLEPFLEAAAKLVAKGADGIVGNCGFLSLFQDELAARCGVPVASSALMQAPLIERLLPPGRRAGILTISAASLTAAHLEAAGVAAGTPIVGTEGGREFSRVILNDLPEMDVAEAARDVLAAGIELVERHPEVGAVLLECTNMCPFARDLGRRLGLPVFDMVSFIGWFHAGLAPRAFPAA
jgi:Asp/Glu/hydantoin racemase